MQETEIASVCFLGLLHELECKIKLRNGTSSPTLKKNVVEGSKKDRI